MFKNKSKSEEAKRKPHLFKDASREMFPMNNKCDVDLCLWPRQGMNNTLLFLAKALGQCGRTVCVPVYCLCPYVCMFFASVFVWKRECSG